jgi:LysR family transcriptional regulator, glycine cleavage system transcriptional activator
MGRNWNRAPSLNTLRVFEATARLLSFTHAATELHVTQAAVSRQIRQLETALGKPLFIRLHRRIELTGSGRRLAADLARIFDAIAHSLDAARGEARQTIRVSVEPAFAARWLLPRLPRFLSAHRDIDVEIDSTETMREIGREADMAIRYLEGSPRRIGRKSSMLCAVTTFPVLAPKLNRRGKPLRQPADLLQYPLLHEDDGSYWQQWFQAAGAQPNKAPRRMRLNDVALVLQAAAEGQGVALGNDLLAGADLRAGRLLKPFDIEMACGAYWLLRSQAASSSSAQRAFADWLRAELSATGKPTQPA